jgi:hypothetical protein
MRKTGACAALIAIMAAAQAHAAPDLAPAFKGTIVSTYPSGRASRLWLNADGTFTGLGAKGGRFAGVWSVKGELLCMRERKPFPMPFTYCTAIPTCPPGEAWAAKNALGEPVQNRLEPGR